MRKNRMVLLASFVILLVVPWILTVLMHPHLGMIFSILFLFFVNPLYFTLLGVYCGLDLKKRWWQVLTGLAICFFFLQFLLKMDYSLFLYLGGYALISIFLMFLIEWVKNWNKVELNEYLICNEILPESFDGFRIVQISDFHNVSYGEKKILPLLKEEKADIIVITGDLIDSRNTKPEISLNLVRELVKLAPVYYIPGNHESRLGLYEKFREDLKKLGCNVLENQTVTLEKENECIDITGIVDPGFYNKYKKEEEREYFSSLLQKQKRGYEILLVHRPEHFETYAGKTDLVFCGHAHGGQFILPFVGGLIAPGQGLFPKYYQGVYHMNGTDMVVSRGAGYTVLPLRMNNPPEIVVVTLKKG